MATRKVRLPTHTIGRAHARDPRAPRRPDPPSGPRAARAGPAARAGRRAPRAPPRAPADPPAPPADAQRPAGYRLAGSCEPGEEDAAAVAGFRIQENLAWG